MTIRVAIIGFGKMGLLHGALLNQIQDVELVAIVDKSTMIRRAFRSVLPTVRYYNAHEKMLQAEDSLDAVVIATPIFSHAQIVTAAINCGLHVFVEKPLAMTYSEAIGVKDVWSSKPNLIVQIGFDHRWMATFRECKGLLDKRELGRIRHVRAEMYIGDVLSPQKGWRYDPKTSGGGVLIDFTVHLIDLLHWFFGEVTEVSMNAKRVFSEKVEDEIEGKLKFKDGFFATINSSWSSPVHRKSYTRLEIEGCNGSVTVTDQTIDIAVAESRARYSDPELYSGYFMDIAGPHFSLQMQDYINCIKSKRRPNADLTSAIYVQKIVDNMYRSANLGTSIPLQ
jgi:predicted dehydrogenase